MVLTVSTFTLDFWLYSCENIFRCFKASQFVVICCGSPQKLIQPPSKSFPRFFVSYWNTSHTEPWEGQRQGRAVLRAKRRLVQQDHPSKSPRSPVTSVMMLRNTGSWASRQPINSPASPFLPSRKPSLGDGRVLRAGKQGLDWFLQCVVCLTQWVALWKEPNCKYFLAFWAI